MTFWDSYCSDIPKEFIAQVQKTPGRAQTITLCPTAFPASNCLSLEFLVMVWGFFHVPFLVLKDELLNVINIVA